MRTAALRLSDQDSGPAAATADPCRTTVGSQAVVQRDCLDGLAELPAACVDVVIISPPYNIGVAYHSYDDRRPRGEYLRWLAEVGDELARVLKPQGHSS